MEPKVGLSPEDQSWTDLIFLVTSEHPTSAPLVAGEIFTKKNAYWKRMAV